jgi:hypothetical protein
MPTSSQLTSSGRVITNIGDYVDRADLEDLLNKEYRKWDNESQKWIYNYKIKVRLSLQLVPDPWD